MSSTERAQSPERPATAATRTRWRHRRTCVGCGAPAERPRARAGEYELVRLLLVSRSLPLGGRAEGDVGSSSVVVDLAAVEPGRGAWVHPRLRCLDAAGRKGLSRAFRREIACTGRELAERIDAAAVARADRLIRGGALFEEGGMARTVRDTILLSQAMQQFVPPRAGLGEATNVGLPRVLPSESVGCTDEAVTK